VQFFATPATRIGYIYLGLLRRKVAREAFITVPTPFISTMFRLMRRSKIFPHACRPPCLAVAA